MSQTPSYMDWMIKTIRNDPALGSWLEDIKYDTLSSFGNFLQNSFSDSKTILLLCDDKRDWFKNYILSTINNQNINRPLIPIYDMSALKDKFSHSSSEENRQYIKDVLDISFSNGYVIWYIGDCSSPLANAPKVFDNSFLWVFDEDIPNALEFKNNDDSVDFKLMQVLRLLNYSISAFLYEDFKLQ
jgi:hypothetical protein